jgi:hypothetical protein
LRHGTHFTMPVSLMQPRSGRGCKQELSVGLKK